MAKASLILHRKRVFDDGSISEIKLWHVPSAVRGSHHTFKYSLFFGTNGARWVGYDNEAGKGDHRHIGTKEEAYIFSTPERLLSDFLADVEIERARRTDERSKK